MDDKSRAYIYQKLNSMFMTNFRTGYTSLSSVHKQLVPPIVAQLYKRWLYSALIPNTEVTPAYFFTYINSGEMPVSNPVSLSKWHGVRHDILHYDIEEHFVIDDLMYAAGFAEGGVRLESDMEKIAESLNIRCAYYADYLIALLDKMNLMQKIPSINTTVYAMKGSFDTPSLKRIFDCSLELAADKINDTLGVVTVDGEKMLTYLKKLTSVDEVIIDIFKTAGVDDIIEVLSKEPKLLNRREKGIAALTTMLSNTVDRWFITVFGYYLGVIRPVFARRCSLETELDMVARLADCLDEKTSRERAVFRCPSVYTLTRTGAVLTDGEERPLGILFEKTDPVFLLNAIDSGLVPGEEESVQPKGFKPIVIK